jgi:hypothetical protein
LVSEAVFFLGLLLVFLAFAAFARPHIHSGLEERQTCQLCLAATAMHGLAHEALPLAVLLTVLSLVLVCVQKPAFSHLWNVPLGRSPPACY